MRSHLASHMELREVIRSHLASYMEYREVRRYHQVSYIELREVMRSHLVSYMELSVVVDYVVSPGIIHRVEGGLEPLAHDDGPLDGQLEVREGSAHQCDNL